MAYNLDLFVGLIPEALLAVIVGLLAAVVRSFINVVVPELSKFFGARATEIFRKALDEALSRGVTISAASPVSGGDRGTANPKEVADYVAGTMAKTLIKNDVTREALVKRATAQILERGLKVAK